jgi:ribosomal protein S18 acetylase RimI-like enzyme
VTTSHRTPAPNPAADIALRPAEDADAADIVDLAQAAYRGQGGWTTEAHLVDGHRTDVDEVRTMLADPAVTLLVAESGGELVGCCYTRREPADTGALRAELGLFAVHPSAQSRGLGGRLLEAQAELLRESGCEVLMIQVLQSRPELHAWYERHGFVRVGRSVPFAGNPEWLKVAGLGMDIMERPLQAS